MPPKRTFTVPAGAMSASFWNHQLSELERAVDNRKRELATAESSGNATEASRLQTELQELEAKLEGARKLTEDIIRHRRRPDTLINIPFGVALGVGAYLFQWAFFYGLALSAALVALFYFSFGRSFQRDRTVLFRRHLLGIAWMLGAFVLAYLLKAN